MTKIYVDDTGEHLATPLPDGKTRRGEANDSMRALVLALLAFVGGMCAVLAWAVLR